MNSKGSRMGAPPSRQVTSSQVTSRHELDVRHYKSAFAVLEHCDAAPTLEAFKQLVVESVARSYRVASATFFVGTTSQLACTDPAPVINGITKGMLPEYQENWYRYDLFGSADTLNLFHTTRVAALSELNRLNTEPLHYVTDYLYRHDVRSATAMCLDLAGGRKALVGLFDRDADRVGPGEIASLRLLARPLSRIARDLSDQSPPGPTLSGLSPRQLEVARLVADGLSNQAIAGALNIHVDSVKKYVSRILASAGCHNRTELALRVRTTLT